MKRIVLLPLLLFFFFAGPDASAQTPTETWIGGNAGFQASPMTFGAGAHLTTGRRLGVRLGYDYADEFTVLGSDPSTLNAVSLSASLRRREGRVLYSAFAGPSAVWGLGPFTPSQDRPAREPYRTVGLAAGVSAIYEIHPLFGIGVEVSGNANTGLSTAGARLGLHFRGK